MTGASRPAQFVDREESTRPTQFLVENPWKVLLLSLATAGLYQFYWAFRVWKQIEATTGVPCRQSLRPSSSRPRCSSWLLASAPVPSSFEREPDSSRSWSLPRIWSCGHSISLTVAFQAPKGPPSRLPACSGALVFL